MKMKKLTCIKLVNWHAFENETLYLENSTLISGENGAGKSTILDAIQFVLTCSKNNFNKAANESSKRKLTGYVRFKTGKENNEYERVGNVTSHVALEFYEESKKNYFVIGAVVDSASESSEKILWYRAEKVRINDMNFVRDYEPVDIINFKTLGRDLKMINYYKAIDAKKDFANRLGKLNEKFFELLPKSLAFKPISDVKDFVYTYILEEREINIEALRENIRNFKKFEEILNETKIKIQKLNEIKSEFESYENYSKTIKIHEHIILMAEETLLENEIEEKINIINKLEIRDKTLEKEKSRLENEREKINDFRNKLIVDLNSNSEYRALEGLKSNLNLEKDKLKEIKANEKDFIDLINKQIKYLMILINLIEENQDLTNYTKLLNSLDTDNLEECKIQSRNIQRKFNNIKRDRINIKAQKEYDLSKKEISRKDIEKKVSELEKRNLQYSKDVVLLKEGIINETKKTGKEVVPKILCELLEITDSKWKNAVEGYLNTQKFYLIVEEDEFDRVLKIYERLSKAQGVHSVGIINTRYLEKYDNPLENSLAEVVTSNSINAKRYINMILGKVIRCNDILELKNHKIAITSSCMVYKNNVARIIDPKVYRTPFIGADAYKYQLEQEKENLNILKEEIDNLKNEIKEYQNIIDNIENLKFESIAEKCEIIKTIDDFKISIKKLENEINELEKNNTYLDIQMKITEVEEKIKKLNKMKSDLDNEKISIGSSILSNKNVLNSKNKELTNKKIIRESYAKEIGYLEEEGNRKYLKEKENKTPLMIINNYKSSKARTETMRDKCYERLTDLQKQYNSAYDFGAEIGINKIDTFFEALYVLEKSRIVEYEQKVKDSKKNAEEEFKEHFISRIQENINIAKREIKSLNNGLNKISFGNENYEFKCGKSKVNKDYYDMIMDTENIGEGFTLFSTSFENKHKDLLNELFEKLTLDDENTENELLKLTDYRNYMEYDIEIKYKDGSSSLFSKVCKEKSGGETQTPFYVAMAASFIQLYKGTLSSSDCIGLVLMDEAFDKMDDVRINAMMNFYKELNSLQLIIGVPPQKIEVITPYVNSVLIAMKDDKFSYVENMINENGDFKDEKL